MKNKEEKTIAFLVAVASPYVDLAHAHTHTRARGMRQRVGEHPEQRRHARRETRESHDRQTLLFSLPIVFARRWCCVVLPAVKGWRKSGKGRAVQ